MHNTEHLKVLLEYGSLIATSITVWTVILISTPILLVYRKIVDKYLKLRYAKNYGGLFNKADTMFFSTTVPLDIMIVLYARCKQENNLLEFITNLLQKKIFDNPDAYPKLTGSKHSFGGYPFWIKNDIHVEEVVKPLKVPEDVVFDDECLKKIVARIRKESHVKNESTLWDVHVSKKTLESNEDQDGVVYPLVFRFHHALADGTSLVALLIDLLGDKSTVNYSEESIKKHYSQVKNERKSILSKIPTILYLIYTCIFLSIGRCIRNSYLKPADNNDLHKKHIVGDVLVTWASEELPESLNMIKRIKSRTNSTFSCILSTAISASITDYFKRNKLPVPNRISGILPALISLPNLDRSKPARLDNKASVFVLDVPTVSQTMSITEALERVTWDLKRQFVYSDLIVMRFIFTYISGLIPIEILPPLLGFKAPTFLLTNVPGASRVHLFDGCVIEKLIPIAPITSDLGVSFAILSYDDRMQLNLTINENAIHSPKEARKIIDDIFYYLRVIDKETRAIYGN